MKVVVELYGKLRETAGWQEREIEVDPGTSAGDLFDRIASDAGLSEIIREHVSVLVGLDYVDFVHVLANGEKVSFLQENL